MKSSLESFAARDNELCLERERAPGWTEVA
jgi:hypothetical protein